MKIGILQTTVTEDPELSRANAETAIARAAAQGADLVILGEMFTCPYENSAFVRNAESMDGPTVSMLSRTAQQHHIYVVGGSFPLRENGKLYNASPVFDRDGKLLAVHRKVHLFDISIEGGQSFRESDTFAAGDAITVFPTEFGRMGLSICFDLRFPELYRLMALQGAKCIFCPAAFNRTTGPMHWELLFRARAVDNQVFLVGCSPAQSEGPYVAYGHSLAVSPWGTVLVQAEEGPSVIVVDLDLSETESVRRQLPLLSARRTDLYELKEIGDRL